MSTRDPALRTDARAVELATRSAAPPPFNTPCVRSDDLLAGRRELLISHGDSLYRLRVTATGKLLLTK